MRKSKFKVDKLDWYVDFRNFLFEKSVDEGAGYQIHLQEFKENGPDYDGPLSYIEECESLPFPARVGIKYCVRSTKRVPKAELYIPYDCYCYQVGRWWKYKKSQEIFTELYIPQIIDLYDWTKLKCERKFLSKQSQKDVCFFRVKKELDDLGRSVRMSVNKCIKL